MVGMAVDLAALPYRCPKCEEKTDFPTLNALRGHLATHHGYRRSSRSRSKSSYSKDVSGRISPLTESFLRQRRLLEEQLNQACIRESTGRLGQSSPKAQQEGLAETFVSEKKSQGKISNDHTGRDSAFMARSYQKTSLSDGVSGDTIDRGKTQYKDISRDITEDSILVAEDLDTPASRRAMRREKRRMEASQKETSRHNMAEALEKARGHVDSLKERADFVVQQQASLIEQLRTELKAKDERLDVSRKQLSALHTDRQRLLVKVSRLSRDQDQNADNIALMKAKLATHQQHIEEKEREVAELSTLLREESEEERSAKAHLHEYTRSLSLRTDQPENTPTSHVLPQAPFPYRTRPGLQRSDSTGTVIYIPKPVHQSHNLPSYQTPQKMATVSTTQQVNPSPDRPSLSLTSSFIGSSSSLTSAPPTLSHATPTYPATPQTVESPLHTASSRSSEPSFFATSGYLSQTTGDQSSTNYTHTNDKLQDRVGIPHLSLSTHGWDSDRFEGVLSPLSPGEVIVNQPHWFRPIGDEQSGRGQDKKGAESTKSSDSPRSLSEHGTLGALSRSTAASAIDSQHIRETQKDQLQSQLLDYNAQYSNHRRVATWTSSSENPLHRLTQHADNTNLTQSLPLIGKSQLKNSSPITQANQGSMRDALTCVFHYLDTPALCNVSLVCREWRDTSRQPSLWRRIHLYRAAVSSKFLKTISLWCTELQSLTFEGLVGRSRRHHETLEEYKKSVRGNLEAGLEALLEAAGDSLLSLRIVDCGPVLTDRCLWLVSCSSRFIQRLAYVSDSDPPGSEVIWALGAGCRDIQTLIIPPKYPNDHPHRFTDRCLTMTAACWPHLLVLCIGGVEVTIKGLTALAKTCTRLQVLELDHICEVTEDTAVSMCRHGLCGLRTLHFNATPVMPRALLHFVSSCASIECVEIHLSITDYFKDTHDVDNQNHYQDVISKLKLVQSRPGMSEIIRISDYSNV